MDKTTARGPETTDLIRRALAMLGKRRRLIISTTILVVVLAWFGTYLVTPRYRASTTIYVQAESPRPALFAELTPPGAAAWPPVEILMGTVGELAKSRARAEQMVREFGLDRRRPPESLREHIKASIDATVAGVAKVLDSIGMLEYRPKDGFRDAVDNLRKQIDAKIDTNTELLIIAVADEDRDRAQKLCNRLVELLVEDTREYGLREVARMATSIEQQLPTLRAELARADERIRAYKSKHALVDLDEEMRLRTERLGQMRADLEQVCADEQETTRKLEVVERQAADRDQYTISSRVIDNNPVVQSLTDQLSRLELKNAALSARVTPRHPDAIELSREIEEARSQLESQARRVLSQETTAADPVYLMLAERAAALYSDLCGLWARREALTSSLRAFEEDQRQLPAREQELLELCRERAIAEQIYHDTAANAEKLALMRESGSGGLNVAVVDPARRPSADDLSPSYAQLVFLIPVCAIVLAFTVALTVEYFDTSYYEGWEVAESLGVPCLAHIPRVRRR